MHSVEDRHEEFFDRTVRRAEQIIRRRRLRRRAGTALTAAAAVACVAVAALTWWPEPDTSVRTVADGEDRSDVAARPAVGEWTPTAPSPLSGRDQMVSAWTGEELLVFAGTGPTSDACQGHEDYVVCGSPDRNDGAAYNPTTNGWRPLPAPPLPEERGTSMFGPTLAGVWTGAEWIVWGGSKAKGAAYNPTTDRWRPIADGPLTKRTSFSMTWTGGEIVIFGGGDADHRTPVMYDDGAVYNPTTDEWRPISKSHAGRVGHEAHWVDGQLIVVGGTDYETGAVGTAEAYNPAADTWRELAGPPFAPEVSVADVAQPPHPYRRAKVLAFAGRKSAAYDPGTNRWTTLPEMPRPDGLRVTAAVWTGTEAVVLRTAERFGRGTAAPPAAFDPAANTWRMLPLDSVASRSGQAVAWTGNELLVWGGATSTGFSTAPANDGVRYRP